MLQTNLQGKGWIQIDDDLPRFQYDADQIAAAPPWMSGPGWQATICGQHAVSYELTTESAILCTFCLSIFMFRFLSRTS